MENLSDAEIKRVLDHIEQNDLDYQYVDNGVFRPFLMAYDSMKIQLHANEESYWMSIYDRSKDKPGSVPYEWIGFETLMQLMEALKHRDESIYKQYWELTSNSIEVPFDKSNYDERWHEEFAESDGYTKETDTLCTYVVFESEDYEPEIMSPWNTVGSDSLGGILHESRPSRLNKLRFEIHPVRTAPGGETYLFKVLCNDDEKFPEHICYKVVGKKGLRLIRQSLFNEMERFKKQR